MKRSCEGCRTLNTFHSPRCDLDYEIEGCKEIYGLTVKWKPKEECPKPKTISDFYYYFGLRHRNKY